MEIPVAEMVDAIVALNKPRNNEIDGIRVL